MLHCIKYGFISLLRNKIVVFWLLGFPIILGTLFFAAFGSLADSEDAFSQIPVGVIEGEEPPQGLDIMLEMLSSDESALLDIKTTDLAEAKELMEKGELCGIIYSDKDITLEVPAGAGIESGILKSVLDGFKTRYSIIADIAVNHPEKINEAIESIDYESKYISSDSNSANDDPYIQYFYNLLAMAGLLGAMMGMYCAINHQANLSPLGARVEVSPVRKINDILSSLIATTIVHSIFINIGAAYLVFVLGIDFGVSFGIIMIVNLLSVILGDTMGCFIGSIGTMGESQKNAILLVASLGLCFLSGLMFGGMRLLIEENAPFINRINPAALIVDCFYSLCAYDDYGMFINNVIVLLIWCALFIIGSLIMTRSRKYKSL